MINMEKRTFITPEISFIEISILEILTESEIEFGTVKSDDEVKCPW